MKYILGSLEAKNSNSNLEFYYMSHENPSQPIFVPMESSMRENYGWRCLKILLDFHEIIVGQVLNVKCACNCHSRSTRKSFNKVLYFNIPSIVNDNE
jgi:hypothetical protein